MSGYRMHLLFYLASLAAAAYFLAGRGFIGAPYEGLFEAAFVGAVYSILPDVDSPSSRIRSVVNLVLLAVAAASLIFGDAYVSVAAMALLALIWFTRHRGAMHGLVAAVALSAPFMVLGPAFFLAALWGYVSHIVLDMLT